MGGGDCVPLKLGLRLSGPALVLLYRDEAASGLFSTSSRSSANKLHLRQRIMPVRGLNSKADCAEVATR